MRPSRRAGQFAQRLDRRAVVLVHEQPLGRVALPAAGAVEGGDQARGVEPVEPGDGPRLLLDGIDPVDASFLAAGAEVDLLLHIGRDPLGMLDDRAVHVGDPERTVGPGLELRGTEPVVAGGQELAAGLVRPADAAIARAVGLQHHPVDQVVHRLADEQAGGVVRPEEVVAIRGGAVGRGHVVGRLGIVEPRQGPADRDAAGCRARASVSGRARRNRGCA